MNIQDALKVLGLETKELNFGVSIGNESVLGSGATIASHSPVDGSLIGRTGSANRQDFDYVVGKSREAFAAWRSWPAPARGEVVRAFGNALREKKAALGALVSFEMGKSYQEGLGEVQEMIDICDFAVGLSRQLYGLTIHSERPNHRMFEQWHPLGTVGIITAFNFPVAVWAWNTALAWVCGDTTIWKPSEKVPLCGVACQKIAADVFKQHQVPEGVSCLVQGDREVGEWIAQNPAVALVSATGSTRMGRQVGQVVAGRLGRSLLELGGNNALIVSEDADLDLAIRAVVFGAVGTAGQRCTSTRRVIIQNKVYDQFVERLQKAYGSVRIGDPLDENNHMGPLIDAQAVEMYLKAIESVKQEGGKELIAGGKLQGDAYASGCYVKPCVIEAKPEYQTVQHETFAPILYLLRYESIQEAIDIQNAVPQGLSSAIFTRNLLESEAFLSASGSDCGIANVNLGTSGAEIGGAFGGEKETGGGRESGSDAWKAYMRRQTNTINYGTSIPLAQGIQFDL